MAVMSSRTRSRRRRLQRQIARSHRPVSAGHPAPASGGALSAASVVFSGAGGCTVGRGALTAAAATQFEALAPVGPTPATRHPWRHAKRATSVHRPAACSGCGTLTASTISFGVLSAAATAAAIELDPIDDDDDDLDDDDGIVAPEPWALVEYPAAPNSQGAWAAKFHYAATFQAAATKAAALRERGLTVSQPVNLAVKLPRTDTYSGMMNQLAAEARAGERERRRDAERAGRGATLQPAPPDLEPPAAAIDWDGPLARLKALLADRYGADGTVDASNGHPDGQQETPPGYRRGGSFSRTARY